MRVTAETKEATRKGILEVAEKQFAQQGFDAATTRDIARAARIGVGTLFNYFPTKDSIALDSRMAITEPAPRWNPARPGVG
jgi:AcrR family transcriptional regulator